MDGERVPADTMVVESKNIMLKDVVQAAADAGIRSTVKIMIGGAPVTESFCQSIGADKYTPDAATAAEVAAALCA